MPEGTLPAAQHMSSVNSLLVFYPSRFTLSVVVAIFTCEYTIVIIKFVACRYSKILEERKEEKPKSLLYRVSRLHRLMIFDDGPSSLTPMNPDMIAMLEVLSPSIYARLAVIVVIQVSYARLLNLYSCFCAYTTQSRCVFGGQLPLIAVEADTAVSVFFADRI